MARSTFSMDNGALTLHEPPAVLRAKEPQTDEEHLQVCALFGFPLRLLRENPHRARAGVWSAALRRRQPPGQSRAARVPPAILRAQVKVTRILLHSYFVIARSALVDTVPKAVVHFLVNSIGRSLQQHLIRTLYREQMFAVMLQEASAAARGMRADRGGAPLIRARRAADAGEETAAQG